MKPELLHVLACPACRGDAPLTPSADTLTCTACARTYPIVGGVPRMLLGTESQDTKRAFTQQWTFRYRGDFERENRVFWLDNHQMVDYLQTRLFPEVTPGEWVIDAGCGSGEKAMALARAYPQATVVAMDFSETVGTLFEKARDLPNLHVVQGDVMQPPFRRGAFDKLISLGVLHHTPDTKAAYEVLVSLAAPKSRMVLWLYPHFDESPLFNKVYYLFRDALFLGRGHTLPPLLRLWLLRLLCLPLFLLMPIFLLSKATAKAMYRDMTMSDVYRGLVFMFYDNLAPKYQYRHKKAEVEGWYRAHAFEEVTTPEFGLYVGSRTAQA